MASDDPLAGIELLVFDKDGTLIESERMWGTWVEALAHDLETRTGLDLASRLYALLGVDRRSGMVHPHGLMAATPISRIRDHVSALVSDAGAGAGAAERAVAAAWHAPDPVDLAQPVTDLPALLARLRARVPRFAVATADDREPTIRTLAALGILDEFAGLACADDGHPVKPAADAVLRLCAAVGVPPGRTAIVGDAPADLRMARAAGAGRAIAVLSGIGDRASLAPLADVVLESIADLAPVPG